MGNDFSSTSMLSHLAAPVQSLAAWFVPAQSVTKAFRTSTRAQQMVLPFTPDATAVPCPATAVRISSAKPLPKPSLRRQLRVVREFDSAVSPSCAGRMVISGRMADVCAELERMSQRETWAK